MELNYKDIFYNFIEAFIYLPKPENPLKEELAYNLNKKSIDLYMNLDRFSLDYEISSMIILDSKYFTDDAYLYYFPMTIKNIIENNGLIEAIINRMKIIDLSNFETNQQNLITQMIDSLIELKQKMDLSSDDFVLII